LFDKLVREYPNSELKEKAQYSIALAYYYLANEKWSNLSDTDISWRNMAVKSFYDFVNRFPKSSLADDALLSIAYVNTVDKSIALQALERLLNEYPNGDRKKDAQKRIEELRGQIPKNNSSSQSGVGIGMDSEYKGTGVLILYTLPDSPASKAGLKVGTLLFK
jgi:outer membrane protein assembly factor BamD (BamD/ComL family)